MASPALRPRRPLRPGALLLAALALLVLLPAGLSAAVRAVATTTILGDVTRRLAGPQAEVTTLMPVGADPHQFAPSARQAAALRRADLVVANGLGLESGLASFLRAARDDGADVLEAGPRAAPRPAPDGRPDPHFWTDPRRMDLAVRAIARELAARLPAAGAREVGRRAAAYRGRLRAEDARTRRLLAPIAAERRNLVTNHHVLGYFGHRYRFRVLGAVIPSTSTLASPSAADLAALAGVIRRARVPAIFVDSSSPRRLAEALASQSGLRVRVVTLYSESLGRRGSGADSYLGMLRVNATLIARAFGV